MKATQFIKYHGLERAREVVSRAPDGATHYRDLSCGTRYTKNVSESECYVWTNAHWRKSVVSYQIFTSEVIHSLSDLKRLVESVDLVNYWGGLEGAKDYADFCFFKGREERGNRIKQAITDYESIYGEGNE